MYFLYVKTHNQTGKKYLGQTKREDPFKYQGSGTVWKRHLQKYGNDISTELIGAFDTLEDLAVAGCFWSHKWDIVDSKEWANLTIEEGFGGALNNKGKRLSDEHKQKLRKPKSEITKQKLSMIATGRKFSDEVNKKKACVGIKNGMFGRKRTLEMKYKGQLTKAINKGRMEVQQILGGSNSITY